MAKEKQKFTTNLLGELCNNSELLRKFKDLEGIDVPLSLFHHAVFVYIVKYVANTLVKARLRVAGLMPGDIHQLSFRASIQNTRHPNKFAQEPVHLMKWC